MFKYPVVSLAIHSFGRKITNALVNEKPVNFTQASTGSGDEWITLEDCSPSLPIRVVLKTKK
jgi:hypothetical protein